MKKLIAIAALVIVAQVLCFAQRSTRFQERRPSFAEEAKDFGLSSEFYGGIYAYLYPELDPGYDFLATLLTLRGGGLIDIEMNLGGALAAGVEGGLYYMRYDDSTHPKANTQENRYKSSVETMAFDLAARAKLSLSLGRLFTTELFAGYLFLGRTTEFETVGNVLFDVGLRAALGSFYAEASLVSSGPETFLKLPDTSGMRPRFGAGFRFSFL